MDDTQHDACRLQKHAAVLISALLSASCVCHVASFCVRATHPVLASNMTLSFVLGLRHAVDCDHLAAIDNVTRQLLRHNIRAVTVGFWFALGHSTIVVLLCLLLSLGYQWALHATQGSWMMGASTLASLCSAALILAVGLLNAQIALQLLLTWCSLRHKPKSVQEEALNNEGQAGLQSAWSSIPCLQRVFVMVNRPEKMYLVGFLFGLSFDSATQVGLLGLAAMTSTDEPLPLWTISLVPFSFSCGMCLVDTANGLLMLATYSWADVDQMQKLTYNLVVTSLSSILALAISMLEVLQIFADKAGLDGGAWTMIKDLNMASIGYAIIGCFLIIFLTSISTAKCCRRRATSMAAPLLG